MKNKYLMVLKPSVAALIMVFSVGAIFNTKVFAKDDHKMTICHRTNSASNPYVSINIDTNAADGIAGNSGNRADHYGEHQGPLASSETVAQNLKNAKIEWGDIIAPIAPYHDGLNWTSQGQAIYNNGCNYTSYTVNPSPNPEPSPSTSPSPDPGCKHDCGGNEPNPSSTTSSGGSDSGSGSTQGEILGVSTLADTGNAKLLIVMGGFATILLGVISLYFAKTKKISV